MIDVSRASSVGGAAGLTLPRPMPPFRTVKTDVAATGGSSLVDTRNQLVHRDVHLLDDARQDVAAAERLIRIEADSPSSFLLYGLKGAPSAPPTVGGDAVGTSGELLQRNDLQLPRSATIDELFASTLVPATVILAPARNPARNTEPPVMSRPTNRADAVLFRRECRRGARQVSGSPARRTRDRQRSVAARKRLAWARRLSRTVSRGTGSPTAEEGAAQRDAVRDNEVIALLRGGREVPLVVRRSARDEDATLDSKAVRGVTKPFRCKRVEPSAFGTPGVHHDCDPEWCLGGGGSGRGRGKHGNDPRRDKGSDRDTSEPRTNRSGLLSTPIIPTEPGSSPEDGMQRPTNV